MPVAYIAAPLTYRWIQIWTVTGHVETMTHALLATPQGLVVAGLAAVAIPAMARLLGLGWSPSRDRSKEAAAPRG